jgi:hypothetical protein
LSPLILTILERHCAPTLIDGAHPTVILPSLSSTLVVCCVCSLDIAFLHIYTVVYNTHIGFLPILCPIKGFVGFPPYRVSLDWAGGVLPRKPSFLKSLFTVFPSERRLRLPVDLHPSPPSAAEGSDSILQFSRPNICDTHHKQLAGATPQWPGGPSFRYIDHLKCLADDVYWLPVISSPPPSIHCILVIHNTSFQAKLICTHSSC